MWRHYCYKIINLINNKIYVGIHSCECNFFDTNYYGSGELIIKSLAKYGKCNFKREVLLECDTRKKVSDFEAFVVNDYFVNRVDNYNLRTGGDNEYQHHNSTKNKMKNNMLGANNHRFGTTPSQETKDKLRNSLSGRTSPMKGRTLSDQHKQALITANIGRHRSHSQETKDKISAALIGNEVLQETKDKISKSMKGRVKSAETKKRMSGKKPTTTCPHCGKVGAKGSMSRYHFDNCKHKESLSD